MAGENAENSGGSSASAAGGSGLMIVRLDGLIPRSGFRVTVAEQI